MASKATITAKTSTGNSVTAQVLTGVRGFSIDFIKQVLLVTMLDNTVKEYDISANNTSTLTYSNPDYTLTIS